MSNYETAKLIRSVVSERDLVSVMTHFHLYEGRIQGSNGKLTLDAPWPDYTREEPINVPAEPFVKAFEAMEDPHISLKDEFLFVQEKRMRVKIPLSTDFYPFCAKPETWDPIDNEFLTALRKVRPFISDDASRLWACSAMWIDGYLYATNNVVLVRTPYKNSWWHPTEDSFTIPSFTIDQLARCQKSLEVMHLEDSRLTFQLEGDVWLDSARYHGDWPDMEKFFDHDWGAVPPLAGNEKDIVEKLLPFVPDKRHPVIQFKGDSIATMEGGMEAAVETNCGKAAFHAAPLMMVLKFATHMKVDNYPNPVPFIGANDDIQGIIAGVRI